jgi:hypothetical protein
LTISLASVASLAESAWTLLLMETLHASPLLGPHKGVVDAAWIDLFLGMQAVLRGVVPSCIKQERRAVLVGERGKRGRNELQRRSRWRWWRWVWSGFACWWKRYGRWRWKA